MTRLSSIATAIRTHWRAIALTVLLLLAVVIVGVVVYLETPYGPDDERLSSVEDRPDVTLERVDGTLVISGGEVTEETVGIVFYPGARVHHESYAWTFADLVADEDVVVIIPEMPLNLAILDSDAAGDVIAAHEERAIEQWIVGGHSLGGAMACRYAADAPETVDGVLLFAAYCDDDDDLRGTDLPVLSVLGTADGVITTETERANRALLGERATIVEISGMNHAQFGAYGDQRGDETATIDDEDARDQLRDAVGEWLTDHHDDAVSTLSVIR